MTITDMKERQRLAKLYSFEVLDSVNEQAYDDIARLAAYICETPIAMISLVDASRQWFKSQVGIDLGETDRNISFCSRAIQQPRDVMIVANTLDDPRFADNPLVAGAHGIRFYAGAPLVTTDGFALGAVCVMDKEPRELLPAQVDCLRMLSRQVGALLELRRAVWLLQEKNRENERYQRELENYKAHIESVNAQLEKATITDKLTGISNRRAFDQRIQAEVASMQRNGFVLSLLLVDIDHFKRFNDTHGHQAGDKALQQVASTLERSARPYDLVARYGGEEFAVILPNTDQSEAIGIAERMRSSVADEMTGDDRSVTVSIGVATGRPEDDEQGLIKRADEALYEAKGRGRNQVVHSARL